MTYAKNAFLFCLNTLQVTLAIRFRKLQKLVQFVHIFSLIQPEEHRY